MSDDIVTRLRHGRIPQGHPFLKITPDDQLHHDAADEIERLRAEVKEWRDIASDYYYIDTDCECLLCERYRKAAGIDEQTV